MTEAYLIEDGKITEPIREGNLIGNGPKVLQDIDVVGNDFAMGSPGTCGKDGQGVPVGDGVPTLRVARLTGRGHRGMSVSERPATSVSGDLLDIADRIVGAPRTASRWRRSSGGRATPRCGRTTARSSRCPRPSRRGWACGSSSATGRASPTPAASTRT